MAADDVGSIEIDMDYGLVTTTVGNETVIVDFLRPTGARLAGLVREMIADLRGRIATGGEDNCASCTGECCTGWAMGVTSADIDRLAKGLGISRARLVRERIDPYVSADGEHPFQLRHVVDKRYDGGTRCSFLKVTVNKDGNPVGRCSVYEHRPEVCRAFPAHGCDHYVPATNLLKRLTRPHTSSSRG